MHAAQVGVVRAASASEVHDRDSLTIFKAKSTDAIEQSVRHHRTEQTGEQLEAQPGAASAASLSRAGDSRSHEPMSELTLQPLLPGACLPGAHGAAPDLARLRPSPAVEDGSPIPAGKFTIRPERGL